MPALAVISGIFMPLPSFIHRHSGFFAGLSAFCMWGSLVIYWKQLDSVPALEILSYRIVFSFLFLIGLISLKHHWAEVKQALSQRSTLLRLVASTCAVTINWGLYIWAVTNGHITESSLGYYINPLTSIVAGAIFFGEHPCRLQWAGVGIAALGVLYSVLAYGHFPTISLVLAISFTIYGGIRKGIAIGAVTGLFIETLLLAPLALGLLVWLHGQGQGHFFTVTPLQLGLILGTGVVTTAPLLLFTYAARNMALSTLGIIQYLSPTVALLCGAYLYGESISPATQVTFACIWVALALYSWSTLRLHQQTKQALSKRA
jgi:chloramphenicol-sensitive protein RarD